MDPKVVCLPAALAVAAVVFVLYFPPLQSFNEKEGEIESFDEKEEKIKSDFAVMSRIRTEIDRSSEACERCMKENGDYATSGDYVMCYHMRSPDGGVKLKEISFEARPGDWVFDSKTGKTQYR